MPCPARFTRGKETQYPMYRRPHGSQGWSRLVQKILPAPGFDPWIVNQQRVTNLPALSQPTHLTCNRVKLCCALVRMCVCCSQLEEGAVVKLTEVTFDVYIIIIRGQDDVSVGIYLMVGFIMELLTIFIT